MKPQFLDLILGLWLTLYCFSEVWLSFWSEVHYNSLYATGGNVINSVRLLTFLVHFTTIKKVVGFIWGSLRKRYNGYHGGGFQCWEPPCIFLRSVPHAESNRIALLLIFVCMHAVREISFDSCTWSISQMFRPELPERSIGYSRLCYLVTSLVCATQLQFLFCTTISLYCNGHCNSSVNKMKTMSFG